MKQVEFTSEAEAKSFAEVVDADLGYPLAGVDTGRGLHVPPEQSITLTFAKPEPHPTDTKRWAYPAPDKVTKIAEVAAQLGKGEVARDPSWEKQVKLDAAAAAPVEAEPADIKAPAKGK